MPRCGPEGFAAVAIDRPGCLAVSDAARSGGIGVELSALSASKTRKGKLHRAASTCEQTKMMALRDRLHAIQFGIVAGVPAHEHDGETLLYSIGRTVRVSRLHTAELSRGKNWTGGASIRVRVSCVVRRRIFWLAYTWHGWEGVSIDVTNEAICAAGGAREHLSGFVESGLHGRFDLFDTLYW